MEPCLARGTSRGHSLLRGAQPTSFAGARRQNRAIAMNLLTWLTPSEISMVSDGAEVIRVVRHSDVWDELDYAGVIASDPYAGRGFLLSDEPPVLVENPRALDVDLERFRVTCGERSG